MTADSPTPFATHAWIAAAIVVALLLFWWLSDVWVVLFGGIVFATALDRLSGPLRKLGLPRFAAIALTVLIIVLLLSGAGWLMGARLVDETERLRERLPESIDAFRNWLEQQAFGRPVLNLLATAKDGEVPWSRLAEMIAPTFGALGHAFLMLVLAIYLAVNPQRYLDGAVRMFPVAWRNSVRDAMVASGDGLGSWLLGQAISMAFVGVMTATGLLLLGVPLAFSLGVIAALLAFVPFFGPIASGILAVLVAFADGPMTALYVAILCLAIQQIEGDILMPLVQRWAVQLAPALGLMAVLVFALLFGGMGIVFATPMMVVLMILVQRLYVEDILEGSAASTA